MYASTSDKIVDIATAVGIDTAGAIRSLSLSTIAKTDDPLIAESAVEQAIRDGEADVLCAEIAVRVRKGVVRVEVVEERHDVVARAAGKDSLVKRSVHASCEVKG